MKALTLLYSILIALIVWSSAHAESIEGRVQFSNRIEMGFLVSGVVESINVTAGQHIKNNHKLITLDKTPFIAALTRARASVKLSMINRIEKMRDFKLAQELYERSASSTVDLENAKFKFERADANFSIAKTQLINAEYELKQSILTAPFDGVILDVKTHIGQRIISTLQTKPVVIFAAIGEYTVHIQIPITMSVSLGQSAVVTVTGKQFIGQVKSVAYEPVKSGKSDNILLYDIGIDFKTSRILLRAGSPALIEL